MTRHIAWWLKMSLDDGVQKRFNGEQETYQDDKKNGPYIILLGFFPPSTVFLCQAAKFKPWKCHFSDNELCHLVSPCSYAVFQWRHKISVLVFWAFFCCIFIKRKVKLLKGYVHTYPNIFETIFSSVLSLLPSTIKRRFQAPKTYVL